MYELDKINELRNKNAVFLCTTTGKLYKIGPEDGNSNILLLSSSGYREMATHSIEFSTQASTGNNLIKGLTTLNGYGAYSSPFEAIIYVPLTSN